MSKSDEDKLMSEFFQARRQERCEEKELLLHDRRDEQLDPLKDKEFVGGSVFDRCTKLAIELVRESERCDALFRRRCGLSFV